MNRILIVEDDKALSMGIALALKSEEMTIVQVYSIKEAWKAYSEETFALIILDINLPDGNGFDLLHKIREHSFVPIILLTANDLETDIVTGLEMGADDYITKPFSLMILRARVNTQLRKKQVSQGEVVKIDDFTFDFMNMKFEKRGQEISLSKTEQKLLKILVENRGNTISRAVLVDRIWTDGAEYVDENALSVTIKRLRSKIEDERDPIPYIRTVYGIGYMWAVEV
ncbi:response regulator transcription factor [Anaerosporobacter faecicola]|uniref:response regulator transcription factor n=1 Tax=Anaerosporobacter faecicola TaxID=2718714 RepID=UPI001438FFFB|nr:response regulator transcription factor [Anaerosporobacter faecicola]